jgi:hypothetical protein
LFAQHAICACADAVQPAQTPRQGANDRALSSTNAKVLRRLTTSRLCT